MNENFARSNFRFLALALAGNAAMAILFLLLSWAIGGTPYFKEVLLGESLLAGLVVLAAAGIAAFFFLNDKKSGDAAYLKAA